MKPKHSLLAALCAFTFAGAAHAAIPVVDCAAVAHWTNGSEYPHDEVFVHYSSLYRTVVPVARGVEPTTSGRENDFQLLGRCAGRGRPARINEPLDGSVVYQGVTPALGDLWVDTLWGEPITRVGIYFNGKIIQEQRPPIFSTHIGLPEPTKLGPARVDVRVAYADGTEHTETAQLNVLPAEQVDRVAPAKPNAILGFAGADTASIRWDAVNDAPGGSGGVRYRVTLARQTYILDEGVTSIDLTDLRRDTRHLIQVEAIDRAGNASPKALVIAKTTP